MIILVSVEQKARAQLNKTPYGSITMSILKTVLVGSVVILTAGAAFAGGHGAGGHGAGGHGGSSLSGNHITEFTQGGSHNYAKIEQYGYKNRFGYNLSTFTQGMEWDTSKSGNDLRVYQDGKWNVIGSTSAGSYQTGNNNKMALKQTSDKNKILVVRQKGSSHSEMTLIQDGHGEHLIKKAETIRQSQPDGSQASRPQEHH